LQLDRDLRAGGLRPPLLEVPEGIPTGKLLLHPYKLHSAEFVKLCNQLGKREGFISSPVSCHLEWDSNDPWWLVELHFYWHSKPLTIVPLLKRDTIRALFCGSDGRKWAKSYSIDPTRTSIWKISELTLELEFKDSTCSELSED